MKFFLLSWLVPALGFGFVLCLPLCGQNLAVGFSGSIPVDTLKSMNDTLQVADRASQVDLLKRLGVDANVAEAATSPGFSQNILMRPIRKHSPQPFGIVALPCGTGSETYLYLLGKEEGSRWHVVDSAGFDCFGGAPAYSLLSFTPGEDGVLVQHANSGHGSGVLETSATLYTVRNGHLREILTTPDYIRLWSVIDVPPMEQASTFVQLPGKMIEETRISLHDGLPVRAERRLWRWQAKQQHFRATLFYEIREPETHH